MAGKVFMTLHMLQELLYDPFPKVRSLSIKGLSKVMTEFWEMIPADTVKNLVLTLIQDLLADASSSDVRQGVVKVSLLKSVI